MISVELKGATELETKLLALETKVGRKIVRKALREVQKTLIPRIKQQLSAIRKKGSISKDIARALTVRAQKKQRRGTYAINVLLKKNPKFESYKSGSFSYISNKKGTGRGRTIGRSYVPAAIEFGHGMSKESAARPFMRPAADATEKSRIRLLAKKVGREIAIIWRKK